MSASGSRFTHETTSGGEMQPVPGGRLGSVLLLALVAWSLAPGLAGQFTNFDDHAYVVDNPLIRSLDLATIGRMFRSFDLGHYQPLVHLSFAIDHAIWGLNPVGFHLTNLGLHLLNVLLVLALLRRWGMPPDAAWVAALVFGAHPLRVESVVWITERKDVLHGAFFLVSLLAWMRWRQAPPTGSGAGSAVAGRAQGGPGPVADELGAPARCPRDGREWWWIAWLAAVAAGLTKGTAMVLPIALWLQDATFGPGSGRSWRRASSSVLRSLGPFVLVGIGVAVAAAQAVGPAVGDLAWPERMAVAGYGVLYYPLRLLIPRGLSPFDPYPGLAWQEFPGWLRVAPVVAALVLLAAVWLTRRRPVARFALGFYLVTVGPFLQLVPAGAMITATWFSYLSTIPLIGLVVGTAAAWFRRWSAGAMSTQERVAVLGNPTPEMAANRAFVSADAVRCTAGPSSAGRLAGCGPGSRGPLSLRFWRWLQASPAFAGLVGRFGPVLVVVLLGAMLLVTRERCAAWRDSVTLWTEVMRQRPCAEALVNRAMAWLERDEPAAAEADLQQALAMEAPTDLALLTLGRLRRRQGNLQAAVRPLRLALQLSPTLVEGHCELGWVTLALGDPVRAREHFRQAARLAPDRIEVRHGLAAAEAAVAAAAPPAGPR